MSILKLTPACKDYLWGGTKLITDYGKRYDGACLAETWELSGHPDGPSVLASGPDAGKTLAEYLAAHPGALGEHGRKFAELPVLIKLIDAAKDLSIQVHPDDAYARAHEGQNGKTEMWYVLSAEPDAFLYCGFSRDISRDELARRIADNTLPEVLRRVNVKAGDTVFIPAGTIHAICRGIVVAEVQQSSNVTYRVCDYGRLGPDGKPRALHIAQALDVTRRTASLMPDSAATRFMNSGKEPKPRGWLRPMDSSKGRADSSVPQQTHSSARMRFRLFSDIPANAAIVPGASFAMRSTQKSSGCIPSCFAASAIVFPDRWAYSMQLEAVRRMESQSLPDFVSSRAIFCCSAGFSHSVRRMEISSIAS